MTHLNPTEFHLHRTSCLTGGEFPCRETLPPEPYDPIWDGALWPIHDPCPQHVRWSKKSLLLE